MSCEGSCDIGVMTAENQLCQQGNKLHLKNIYKNVLNYISQYYYCYCRFDKINAALAIMTLLSGMLKKILPCPNIWTVVALLCVLLTLEWAHPEKHNHASECM